MKKLTIILSFLSLILLSGCGTPEPVIEEKPVVPDKTYEGEGFVFDYPGEYTADSKGVWTEEGYKKHIYQPKECDTCQIPQVEVISEITDKSIEEYIAADFTFGDSSLEQMAENDFISYENITIGDKDFIKIRVDENFAVTGYYTHNGKHIVSLRVYFDERDDDELMKMLETLVIEEPVESEGTYEEEIPFASCGDADKYSNKGWFGDFSEQIRNTENIQVMCLSKDGSLVITVYNSGAYCGRGKIFRYFTEEKILEEARMLGEVHDCSAGFIDIGKREGTIIPVIAQSEDGECLYETDFEYSYTQNTIKPIQICSKCIENIDGNEVTEPERCIEL